MMSNNSPFRRICIAATTLLALGLVCACATSKRPEPAGSAVPVNAAAEPPQEREKAATPSATELRDEASEESAPAASPPLPQQAQSAPSRTESHRSAGKPAGGARPSAAPARAPSTDFDSPSPKKSKAEVKAAESGSDLLAGPDDGADPLLPTTRDSSDLRVALQDWQNAATQLATSHGCDDGCRAFQSMQRAAARICNLVINQDPAQRCATAKSRVQDAQRDISQRCGKCER